MVIIVVIITSLHLLPLPLLLLPPLLQEDLLPGLSTGCHRLFWDMILITLSLTLLATATSAILLGFQAGYDVLQRGGLDHALMAVAGTQ